MKSYLNHIRTFFHNHYKKIIGVMVLLLIILVVILPRKQEAPEMYTVTMRDVIEGVRVGGLVEAASVADLGFAASGQVRTVSVGIGDRVRAGQVLATLDSSILAAELRDAEAQLAIARAQKDNQATNLRDVERQQNIIVQNAYRALLSSDIQARPYSRTSTLARPIVSGAYTGNQEGVYEIIVDRRSTAQYFVRLSGLERGEYELLRNQATPIGTRGLFIQFNGELLDYLDTRWIIELPIHRVCNMRHF
ncbi:MAG: biotin/lipoyl-binding protein [Candidatus Pacebacteria bacterium]|nr:biotin/lipoyl-binding protein [Candidatus Paceibacterota bacterium]MCD8527727.1 biotin/lipoyl-binding protein [Candidatus Paceibacterota bacterium]